MEEKKTQEGGSEKTFTQTELDAIIGDRLARERQKYGDYDSLKAKAAEYDKTQEASKSELQKATEKAGALQKELDERPLTVPEKPGRRWRRKWKCLSNF